MKFTFGRNWKSFARIISEPQIKAAEKDIVDWLGADGVKGKTVIDVGCGSGIHSLAFYRLGAKSILSLDVDPDSVACTRGLWEKAGKPANWQVDQASVLDTEAIKARGQFDIVYSWGVLHHTGAMWDALENASALGKPADSRFWISIYAAGPNYQDHLELKRRYNRRSWLRQRVTLFYYLARQWRLRLRNGQKLRDLFWEEGRGMSVWHDAVDWHGGLPYEVASVDEIRTFLAPRGWTEERVLEREECGCSVYLFRR